MKTILQTKSQIAINNYIVRAKNLAIFDQNLPGAIMWSKPTWNISHFVKHTRKSMTSSVPFHNAGRRTPAESDLMAQPFGDLVKAHFAFEIDENADKADKSKRSNIFKDRVRYLRFLDALLRERDEAGLIDKLTKNDLNRGVERAGENTRSAAAYAFRLFVRDLDAASITQDLAAWHHPAMSPTKHLSRINSRKRRKNLTEAEISCLATAYREAKTPKDRFAMSIVALLMCTPSRREEPFILPAQTEIVKNPNGSANEDDTPFYLQQSYKCGLRWWPVKNGPAQVKFVPKEMMPLAVEALTAIRSLTKDARDLAAWMVENPGKVQLPSLLKHVRDTGLVRTRELDHLFADSRHWLSRKGIKALSRKTTDKGHGAPSSYCWATVESEMLTTLPQGWPLLSAISNVDYPNALCISLVNQFHERWGALRWMVQPISSRILDQALSGSKMTNREDQPSIFERLNIRLPDGSYPNISTHEMRHYLNTIAQRARVPQAHIAHWSGRKHVMQNADYDHTDKLFEIEQITNRDAGKNLPSIQAIDDSDTVQLEYLSGDKKMQLHSTAFGYCQRRFIQEPCDRAGACRTCMRLVCLGGSHRSAELLSREAARDERSLQNLRDRQNQGRSVNSKTIEAVELSAARSRALAATILDPANKGKIIRNTDLGTITDFSHASRIIEAKRQEIAAEPSNVRLA